MVPGTAIGAVTDVDGYYVLKGIPANVIEVEISSMGYVSQKISIKGKSKINVVLLEDRQLLEEIIVVGYGTTKKRDLIASVSNVNAEEISNIPVSNLTQGLAGRSPGLIVTQRGGGLNASPSVSIRGGGIPICVIDGVIRPYVDFVNLAPEDIESMSILKDASATAVYGSRASDGIIQVETKKGEACKINVNYNLNLSFSQPSMWPEKISAYDQASYFNKALVSDGLPIKFTEEALNAYRDGSDPEHFPSTDWRKACLKEWAPLTKHNVNVTGGNDINHFYISVGHIDQNSLYKTGTYWMKRTTFRMSESALIKLIGLRINVSLDGFKEDSSHPYNSYLSSPWEFFSHLNNWPTFWKAFNKYGLPFYLGMNPRAEIEKDGGYIRPSQTRINGKAELVWNVPEITGLSLRASTNYSLTSYRKKAWRKDAAQYDWDSKIPRHFGVPQLRIDNNNSYDFTNQIFLNYSNTFKRHSISALVGFEQYYWRGLNDFMARQNYPFDIDQINVGDVNTRDNGGHEEELGRAAVIAQVKYNFDSRYYFEGSLRYDGSDRFAPGKRWGAFFSGTTAWVLTEEKFMRPLVEKNILNMFKARVSYGETGLDESAGRFQYMTSYIMNSKAYVINGKYTPGFSEGSMPSPDLTWYTSKQTDAGFDFASLANRLYGSFDYFFYKTTGYLMAPLTDSYLNHVIGIGMPMVKSDSEHRRAGIELQLGWKDQIGDFTYDISANMTYYNWLWAKLENENESFLKNPFTRTSQQKQNFYGLLYKQDGYYDSAGEVYDSVGFLGTFATGNVSAGDIRYVDINGDGQIDSHDLRRMGNSMTPHTQYGFQLSLGYRGIYFRTLLQGTDRFDIYIPGEAGMQTGQTFSNPVRFPYQEDYWRQDNRTATYPRLMSNTALNANNNFQGSDFWLLDGTYMRIKDISLGYDLKYSVLKSLKWISKLSFGFSAQNLLTFSKALKYGIDPETADANHYEYPVDRVLALTLNVGF